MKTRHLLLAAPLALAPFTFQPAMAADGETADGWTGAAELGASVTTGNTESSTINGKVTLGYLTGPWAHRLRLETLQSSEDGEDTANRTLGEFESNFAFSERDYLFGVLRGTHDEFSGYKYQASAAAGYGRKLWISERGSWDAEIGPGLRVAETEDDDRETNAIARIASGFEYRFSDYAKFNQDVTVLAGQDNTEIESVTGLSSSLTETLAIKLAYTVQYNTDVPAGTEKTDTYTSVNLVYNFD
jgi:putative salt-induced outer membrane protein